MCDRDGICSAQVALEGFTIDSYPLFDQEEVDKRVAIWQPTGRVENLHRLPNPESAMEQKAEQFLRKANESECHLAVAPEWAYNMEWVAEHADLLFSPESPLFVLGCAPMRQSEMEDVIEELQDEYTILPEEVPDCGSMEFVTPTIIPIRIASNDWDADNAVLIQYKNHPMGDGVNSNEEVNLVEGEFVWRIDPRDSQTAVVVLTCSDILDYDLKSNAQRFARGGNSFVVHVQCNPSPFSDVWTRFRKEIFGGGNERVTYVCANWGKIRTNDAEPGFGYSGVYTKAQKRPPLKKYDKTYSNGGLPGTMPRSHCEFVWVLPDDAISLVEFKRRNPVTAGPGGPSFSNPYVDQNWTWNQDTYMENSPGVPECESDVCREWRSSLPDSPRDIELISAIGLGRIDLDEITGSDPFIPDQHIVWSALLNLQSKENEQLGHILASHERRYDPQPEEVATKLTKAFELAEQELNICPAEEFQFDKIPVNATYNDRDVPICLTIVDDSTDKPEQRRAKWIYNWFELQGFELQEGGFKPVIVTTDREDGWVLKTITDHEQVDGSVPDPVRVDATGGLLGGD